MEIVELKQQIKTGKFDHWYIFSVEECAIAKVYIHKIAEKGGYEISYPDSILDIYSSLGQKSLFSFPHLYILMDDKDFLTNEKAWNAIGDGKNFKDDIVIFYYTSKDARLKFWKNFQNRVIEFNKLEDAILVRYIQKDLPGLSTENCKELIDICESDYSRILLEIDKIKQYEQSNVNDAFNTLLERGAVYKAPKDTIFDFVNAVLEREAAKAWDLLYQANAVGDGSLRLLFTLYNSVRTMLILQSAKGKAEGVNGWVAKNISKYKGNYSNGELVHLMSLIKEAETGIKTGMITDDIAMEYVLVEVM